MEANLLSVSKTYWDLKEFLWIFPIGVFQKNILHNLYRFKLKFM